MSRFVPKYKPVHTGVSITDKEAFADYKEWSDTRDPKKFNYYSDYRRLARKIWKRIADDSLEYESGVFDKGFFYLIPQVIANKPFIEMPNGRIKTNDHTGGDIYTPVFCNLFPKFNHFCWSLDGCYVRSYLDKFNLIINKFVPRYYFILPTLLKNKL
jgi:hypothetical protein